MRAGILRWLVAFFIAMGWSEALAKAGAAPSTQPVMAGRDTPAGAMNVYVQALKNLDVSTVADSYNLQVSPRNAQAEERVSEIRVYEALETRFGHDAALSVCGDCRINSFRLLRKYTPDEWFISDEQPDLASARGSLGKNYSPPSMRKGPDGIWRIGDDLSLRLQANPPGRGLVARMAQLATKYNQVAAEIAAGKYATPDDVVHVFYPNGSPMAQRRAAEQQMKAEQEARFKQFMATKFDPSTLDGAVAASVQARVNNDTDSLANFYFAENDADGRMSKANAGRIISAIALEKAIGSKVDELFAEQLPLSFGLIERRWDFPDECSDYQIHGDSAVGLFLPGYKKIILRFRLIGGVWKQDITPLAPHTPAQRAQDMEEDNAAVQRITADVLAGKYQSLVQVRDAMGAAMLNATPGWMLGGDDVWLPTELRPSSRPHPETHNRLVTSRKSPAGTMNTFLQALQNSDVATVADCLYLPEDKDGSCRQAAAQELVVAMRFFRAAQARFGANGADLICFDCGVIGPESLRQYDDDEWVFTADYPDIGFANTTTYGDKSGWIPLMHRGADGLWRIGRRFPRNSRRLHAEAAEAIAHAALLEKAIAAITAGKYATPDGVVNDIAPSTTRP